MSSEISERIQRSYHDLSPNQRKVAEALIQDPGLLAFRTAAEIGRHVGVSESTVIRLSYALGFGGFSEMQGHAQEALAPQVLPKLVSRAAAEFPAGTGIMERMLTADAGLLEQTRAMNRPETFDRAVSVLAGAREIFVCGARSSYGIAHVLWYALQLQVGSATLLEVEAPGFLHDLARIGPDCALVAISFPRYTDSTLQSARYAVERGCPLVAITDTPLSPLARDAAAVLTAAVESVGSTISYGPVLALATALITGVTLNRKEQVNRRLAQLEEVSTTWKRIARHGQ